MTRHGDPVDTSTPQRAIRSSCMANRTMDLSSIALFVATRIDVPIKGSTRDRASRQVYVLQSLLPSWDESGRLSVGG